MPKFSVHVALMGPDFRPVSFAPGDEVPEWAEVGAHCLEPESEAEEVAAAVVIEPESEDDADDEEPTPAPADAPNFTAPAPRRNSRTRK